MEQICFYGWGFYAIGDERTLELNLTGHPLVPTIAIEGPRTISSESSDNTAHSTRSPSQGGAQMTIEPDAVAVDIKLESPSIPLLSTQSSHRLRYGVDVSHCDGDSEHSEHVRQTDVGVTGEFPHSEVCPVARTSQRQSTAGLKHFTKPSGFNRSQMETTAKGSSNAAKDLLGDSDWAKIGRRISVVLTSPNMIAVMVGVFIAMVHPLQQLLFHNPKAVLRPFGAAFEVR